MGISDKERSRLSFFVKNESVFNIISVGIVMGLLFIFAVNIWTMIRIADATGLTLGQLISLIKDANASGIYDWRQMQIVRSADIALFCLVLLLIFPVVWRIFENHMEKLFYLDTEVRKLKSV